MFVENQNKNALMLFLSEEASTKDANLKPNDDFNE